jgi:hypothetical protein
MSLISILILSPDLRGGLNILRLRMRRQKIRNWIVANIARMLFVVNFHVNQLFISVVYLLLKRWSDPSNRPWRPIGLWDIEALTISRKSANRWRRGRPYALVDRFLPTRRFSCWLSFQNNWTLPRFESCPYVTVSFCIPVTSSSSSSSYEQNCDGSQIVLVQWLGHLGMRGPAQQVQTIT